MNPDNRVIVQITIDDAEKGGRSLYHPDGRPGGARRRFIEENAQYAKLDV